MKKKIIAFGMALLLFSGSSMTALAAICPGSNTGGHFFESRPSGMGTMKELYHQYIHGYIDGQPIYRNCKVTQSISYNSMVCCYCGYELENSQHSYIIGEWHSINHN